MIIKLNYNNKSLHVISAIERKPFYLKLFEWEQGSRARRRVSMSSVFNGHSISSTVTPVL